MVSQISVWIDPSETGAPEATAPVPVVYLGHSDALALAGVRPLNLAGLVVLAILFAAGLIMLMLAGQRQVRVAVRTSIDLPNEKTNRDQKLAA